MMYVCNICKEAKEDATNYHLKSTNEIHTFWSFIACIECRDNILQFINSKFNEVNHEPNRHTNRKA